MRLLCCGGRDYTDWRTCFRVLEIIDREFVIDLIIQGGQKTWCRERRKYVGGADYLAKMWAIKRGCPEVEEPANWDRYQKRAGMIRNQAMIDLWSPTHTLAFPGGNGTANMVELSKRAGIPVLLPNDFKG